MLLIKHVQVKIDDFQQITRKLISQACLLE